MYTLNSYTVAQNCNSTRYVLDSVEKRQDIYAVDFDIISVHGSIPNLFFPNDATN